MLKHAYQKVLPISDLITNLYTIIRDQKSYRDSFNTKTMNINPLFDISSDLRIPELIALEKMKSKNETTYFTVRKYIAWEMNAGNSHDWSWDWTEHVDISFLSDKNCISCFDI